MQFQADILDVPVIRPVVNETTALGVWIAQLLWMSSSFSQKPTARPAA
jgi:glycerol kinase